MLNFIKNLFGKSKVDVESTPTLISLIDGDNDDGISSITFEIDDELNVTVKSKISDKIIETLIDSDYLRPEQTEDEGAIQLSFVLIANEITEQIIEEINEKANKLID